jgi:hypothetical protein
MKVFSKPRLEVPDVQVSYQYGYRNVYKNLAFEDQSQKVNFRPGRKVLWNIW